MLLVQNYADGKPAQAKPDTAPAGK
jgi:hypothetical protein